MSVTIEESVEGQCQDLMVSAEASRPSLFLACRLAGLVQKFKQRLQEKVNVRNGDRKINHFGPLYQRGLRKRALSELQR